MTKNQKTVDKKIFGHQTACTISFQIRDALFVFGLIWYMVWLHVVCYWIVTAKFGTWSGYMMFVIGLSQLSLVHGMVTCCMLMDCHS